MNLGPVAKAMVGAAAAGVAPYTAAVLPGSQGGAHVTVGEWLTVVVAVLVASRLVWQADNVRWFPYAKATATALVVFLGLLSVALLSGETVTVQLVLAALFKVALSFGLVSQTPNATQTEWDDPAGSDGEPEPDADPTATAAQPDDEPDDPEKDDERIWTDADSDGHDDTTGQWMPKGQNLTAIYRGMTVGPQGQFTGSSVVDTRGGIGVRTGGWTRPLTVLAP